MITLSECMKFVTLHAKTLGVNKDINRLKPQVVSTMDSYPHGWANIFFNAAVKKMLEGNTDKALGLYNIARFPFPQTELQKKAYKEYLSLFEKKYLLSGELKKQKTKEDEAVFYYKEGNANNVIIICGGIISLKEQWVNALKILHTFGFTVVLCELPGVGENAIPFDKTCFDFFSKILNVLNVKENARCHALAMSFSGYIALKNSGTDPRISSITMVGTPVISVYHDLSYYEKIPTITRETLIHNISRFYPHINNADTLFEFLDSNFPAVNQIPENLNVFYVQSEFDEIIPASEADFLKDHCDRFSLFNLPDVHGSPNFHHSVVLFILWSILKSMHGNPSMIHFIKFLICISKMSGAIKQKYFRAR